jgi:hypothetical protein
MLEFVAGCKEVVKVFYSHHVVKAQLNEMQKAARVWSLERPAQTRFRTIEEMCRSLLDSEPNSYSIVSARDFVNSIQKQERQRIRSIITDDMFADNMFVVSLKKAIKMFVSS